MSQAQTQQQAAGLSTSLYAWLYVGGLDPRVTEAQLLKLFSRVAPMVSILPCTGQSLDYAYVGYNTVQEARQALKSLDCTWMKGANIQLMLSTAQAANLAITNMNGRIFGCKPLYVARAENEEERRAARLQGYGTRGIGQQSFSYDEKQFPPLIPPAQDRPGDGAPLKIGVAMEHHSSRSSLDVGIERH